MATDARSIPLRRIGLIGGMSWESTAQYYRLLNERVAARLGGLHSARILLASVDFAEIEQLQASGDWDAAGALLAAEAAALGRAGVDLVLICTNTMHKVYPAVQAAVDVPVLHLGDVTATAVRAAGLSRVGLLATAYTMEQDFYRSHLAERGVATIVPDEAGRAEVQRIIYDELCRGIFREESRATLRDLAAALAAEGAEGVVLGCTELELVVTADDVSVPLFATTSLHVEAAVAAALA